MINQDDKFDDLLRTAAQDYNRPPAIVPRDAMWEAIEKARTERALRPLHIVGPAQSRHITRYTWLGAAAAAVLLIATGVGIGRWSTNPVPTTSVAPKSSTVAATSGASVESTATPPLTAENPSGSEVAGAGSATVAPRSGERPSSGERNRTSTQNRVALSSPSAGTASTDQTKGTQRGSGQVPYQVATIRHLANAEALLTAFRSDSRDAKMDAQLSKWARDLLANTRLLLDSPAADDPQRARLLGDLELVLAEIVQLSPGSAAQDRDLIEGSIRNGHVITRLRSAIPAGPTRGI